MKFRKKGVSNKKRLANIKNASRSTGPKSREGKLKSSGNATKHGIYSMRRLIEGENREVLEKIVAEQHKTYKPRTFIEKALVDQLVGELWILRRISRAESVQITEVENEILEEEKAGLDLKEKELLSRAGGGPDRYSELRDEVKTKAIWDGRDGSGEVTEFDKSIKAIASKIKPTPDKIYKHIFLRPVHEGAFQRLAALKRQTLANILSLERELSGRLRQRLEEKTIDG